jgi:hypothetical protein
VQCESQYLCPAGKISCALCCHHHAR